LVPRATREATRRAASILEDATARAEELLAEARREAERLASEARARAELDGRAAVASLVAIAATHRDRALEDAEHEVVTLAVAVARRVIDDAVTRDPELIVELARQAIERARGASRLTVLVSAGDAAALEAFASAHRLAISVEVDGALGRGDCVVQTDIGTIDARLATKLDAFEAALLRQLDREAR
jgi:flagellar biosynthesis/type III secretory pathway protein FliH